MPLNCASWHSNTEKRRTWRKLHLAIDVDTHEAISAENTGSEHYP